MQRQSNDGGKMGQVDISKKRVCDVLGKKCRYINPETGRRKTGIVSAIMAMPDDGVYFRVVDLRGFYTSVRDVDLIDVDEQCL